MEKVFILGGLRSHIGLRGGIYKNVPAEALGAEILKRLQIVYGLDRTDIILGGNSVGTGGNITRLAALKAGYPEDVPAITIDGQCSSGLQSIIIGGSLIASGQADVVIAGGLESASTQPDRRHSQNHPCYSEENPFYSVAMFSPETNSEAAMIEGAEKVAVKDNVTKAELDYWSIRSHDRANLTRETGYLESIIAPVSGSEKDEGIRLRMNQKLLDRLPPILNDGIYTHAGNACMVNDGAAFVVLCSENYIEENKLTAEYELVKSAMVGGVPDESPRAALAALEKACMDCSMKVLQLDAIELNEAFAVIDVLFQRKYPDMVEKYNFFGGALAYGHPYGASGAVILLHLLKSLEHNIGKYGACAIAAAGGIGAGLVVKKHEQAVV